MEKDRGGQSDEKLIRALGVPTLTSSIINATVGAGIFVLPAGVAAGLGPAAPIAFIICAIAMALIVTSFAIAGSRVSLTGGLASSGKAHLLTKQAGDVAVKRAERQEETETHDRTQYCPHRVTSCLLRLPSPDCARRSGDARWRRPSASGPARRN